MLFIMSGTQISFSGELSHQNALFVPIIVLPIFQIPVICLLSSLISSSSLLALPCNFYLFAILLCGFEHFFHNYTKFVKCAKCHKFQDHFKGTNLSLNSDIMPSVHLLVKPESHIFQSPVFSTGVSSTAFVCFLDSSKEPVLMVLFIHIL